ncbi:hypothetical protein PSPL106493_07765 [Pseudomonas plecoglossicida]
MGFFNNSTLPLKSRITLHIQVKIPTDASYNHRVCALARIFTAMSAISSYSRSGACRLSFQA